MTSMGWEWSKKSVQQGRSPFCARSVLVLREHGKRARTPLAAFFNVPKRTRESLTPLWLACIPVQILRRRPHAGRSRFREQTH